MENTQIFKIVLGQILRHVFTGLATLLGAYGVNGAMQGQLVEASVAIGVSLIVIVATQAWAYVTTHQAIFRLPPNTEWAIETKEEAKPSA